MNKKVIVGAIFILLLGGIVFFKSQPQETIDMVDADFVGPFLYTCAEGKSFHVEFGDSVARIELHANIYTLELTDLVNGNTYTNENKEVALKIKDYGGSIEEGGKTTYRDCISIPAGAEVAREGVVVEVDKTAAAFDGPVKVIVKAKNGMLSTIAIPSMGLLMCAAYKKGFIRDPYDIKVGEEVEVVGVATEEGSIIPCDLETHYLR